MKRSPPAQPRHWRRIGVALALQAALGAACAQSLVEVYELARAHDASYQSARAQAEATQARAGQARAGLLPTAGLQAGVTRTTAEVNAGPINASTSYTTQNVGLSASQPLYRPANWASYQQGQRQAELAQAQLAAAEQDLIVRISQAYFDVLAAQDTLAVVRAQKSAVGEQLEFAKRNFEVGNSTITDSREAQARRDLVVAQEIMAENDLRIKQVALDQLVGKDGVQPRPLATPVKLPRVSPDDVAAWVGQAGQNSTALAQAQVALDVAQLETQKAQAGHKPTLDLNANYGLTRYPNGNNPSMPNVAASSRNRGGSIGVVLNVPIFAGFATQNRIRETLALEDKARADLEVARRSVTQGTRAAFLGLKAAESQVAALEAASASSQSALEANKLGYQVGVRINIDVLNSQSQLFQTQRDLAKARYDALVGGLKLRQTAGTLKPDDLQAVNALLQK